MARAKRIIIEEANPLLAKKNVMSLNKILKVCAYARVSTDDKENYQFLSIKYPIIKK